MWCFKEQIYLSFTSSEMIMIQKSIQNPVKDGTLCETIFTKRSILDISQGSEYPLMMYIYLLKILTRKRLK